MNLTSFIISIFIIAYVVFILWTVYKIIITYDNNNPIKTTGWILAVIFLPVIGIILYVVVGRNLNRKKTKFRKLHKDVKLREQPGFGFEHNTLNDGSRNEYLDIKTLVSNLSGLPVFPGNQIDIYPNGEEKFKHLFDDMEKATSHIHVLYFTIGDDEIGNKFKKLLILKHKQGIKVRLIYDDMGCNETPKSFFDEMREEGIEVNIFSPVVFPRLLQSVNYRNHKKIVVIDGIIAYTGGINVKDEYVKGVNWGIWKDVQVRIKGPGAQGLQAVFLKDWYYVSGITLTAEKYYPKVKNYGNSNIQVITAEPIDEFANIMQAMAAAILRARKSVYIESPYFVPNETILNAIQIAGNSGIDVRLVMPEKSDNKKVQLASNSYVQQLLSANIKVYRYQIGFIHSKLMLIDDELVIAGSSNMDIRSFELNFETNVFIYDKETGLKAKNIIMNDIKNSTLVDAETWMNRPSQTVLIESFFRLFSPLL